MDKISKEQRSKNMRAVKSKDSKIELAFRKELWKRGYRYRKNYKKIIGKPDIVFIKLKLAIFCDSEFWHGYNWVNKKKEIKSNREFWYNKIESNMRRDKVVNEALKKTGWTVLRFWGKDIEKKLDSCVKIVEDKIKGIQNV